MFEIEELSLLVYASRGNRKDLIKGMCKYTGCKEEDYTEYELVSLLQKTIQDISRKYHIKDLFYNYCDVRNREINYCEMYNNKYLESKTLLSTLFLIMPDTFDKEDITKIKALRKEYIDDEVKHKIRSLKGARAKIATIDDYLEDKGGNK